jgi:hypothetical protein
MVGLSNHYHQQHLYKTNIKNTFIMPNLLNKASKKLVGGTSALMGHAHHGHAAEPSTHHHSSHSEQKIE